MIVTAAAATAVLTALAAKIAAGGAVTAFELAEANVLMAKFGLTGFDVIVDAIKASIAAKNHIHEHIKKQEDKKQDGSV